MAEREIMGYASFTKCTGIYGKVAIFDITIKRMFAIEGHSDIVYEGNMVIYENLNYNIDGTAIWRKMDDQAKIEKKIREAEKRCAERAGEIFSYNKNENKN